MNLKETYDSFKASGELTEVLPGATGVWENDEHEFRKAFSEISSVIGEDDDDEDDYVPGIV